jgi:hypothetical protein
MFVGFVGGGENHGGDGQGAKPIGAQSKYIFVGERDLLNT